MIPNVAISCKPCANQTNYSHLSQKHDVFQHGFAFLATHLHRIEPEYRNFKFPNEALKFDNLF